MRRTFNLKKAYDDYYLYSHNTVYGTGERPRSEYVSPYKENYYIPEHNVTKRMCYNKLGHVEDIEEKRGIEISVLDRIFDYLDEVYLDNLDKPFYEKDEFGIHPITPVFLQLDLRNKRLIEKYHPDSPSESIYPFSEYGKTWALTKEELEK